MKLLRAIQAAIIGITALAVRERNFSIQFVISAAVQCFLMIVKADYTDMLIALGLSLLVLAAEAFNTCIEQICNYIQPQQHITIKYIKDASAGAVLLVCGSALCYGIILIVKYVINSSTI
ncbi:MAG: hypothetical protein RL660_2752 [Bacteroidota bacterium]|jgi:diacylglycerol kinase (ATP)